MYLFELFFFLVVVFSVNHNLVLRNKFMAVIGRYLVGINISVKRARFVKHTPKGFYCILYLGESLG